MFEASGFWMALLVAYAIASMANPARRGYVLIAHAALNIAVLWFVLQLGLAEIGLFLLCICWIAAGCRIVRGMSVTRPWPAIALACGPVLCLWLIGKSRGAQADAERLGLYFVGCSYFVVKAWTFCNDALAGRLRSWDSPTLFAYFTHFPTYVAGPIHYYGEFEAATKARQLPDVPALVNLAFRVAVGFLKVKVVVPLLKPLSLVATFDAGASEPSLILMRCVVYSIVIYADFSGYSDIAIGTSGLLGIPVPENFRRPYLAPNIREFWQRWHISFSRVLTGYVFIPVSRVLDRVAGAHRKLVLLTTYALTFAVCGFWHGPTSNFVAWGLYHALGLFAYDIYRQRTVKARLARRAEHPSFGDRLIHFGSVAGTFLFVSIGWILFVGRT